MRGPLIANHIWPEIREAWNLPDNCRAVTIHLRMNSVIDVEAEIVAALDADTVATWVHTYKLCQGEPTSIGLDTIKPRQRSLSSCTRPGWPQRS